MRLCDGFQFATPQEHRTMTEILSAFDKFAIGKAPKRLQHMLLKSQEYSYQLTYKPGKATPVADALSRAPTDDPVTDEVAINNITLTAFIPERLDRIRGATLLDPVLQKLGKVIIEGWPNDRRRVPDRLLPYFSYRDELTTQDGVIFRGERIVIPSSLRKSMKEKVHVGINSSLRRARDLIYWPQMSTDIRHYVETYGLCATYADMQPAESVVMTDTPDLPWQKVGSDLFSWSGKKGLYGNNRLPQQFLRVRLPTRHDLRNSGRKAEEQFQSTRHTAHTCR